jgi:hypothetical protein
MGGWKGHGGPPRQPRRQGHDLPVRGGEARGTGKRICEEAAWRSLMEPARMAARRLVDRGEVEIVQHGRVVDPSTAKGPLRIRLAR